MRYLLFVTTLLFTTTCFGQISGSAKDNPIHPEQSARVTLDEMNPSVYLEYVRSGDGRKHLDSDSPRRVWLKLVNNSIWSIKLLTFSGEAGLRERGVFHSVEKIKGWAPPTSVPTGYIMSDTGFYSSEILSGDSFIFSIPENHLGPNLMVQVEFSYGWESRPLRPTRSMPKHTVTFSNCDLVRGIAASPRVLTK